jgi:hypothetical protein
LANRFLQLQLNSQSGNFSNVEEDLSRQQQNLNKAQSLTNSCLVLLGKENSHPPLQLTVSLAPVAENGYPYGVAREMAVFIVTNVEVPAPHLLLECNIPFDVVQPGVIIGGGGTFRLPGNERRSRTLYEINVASPSLTPTHPMFVVVSYKPNYEGEVLGCLAPKKI